MIVHQSSKSAVSTYQQVDETNENLYSIRPMDTRKSKTFAIETRVYVEDTDYGGIVYHSNYLNYMERARTEQLIAAGYRLDELAQRNIFFAIRHITIEYHKPAKLNQIITVTSQIIRSGKSSLVFAQTVTHNEHLLCQAEIVAVCINEKARPVRVPQDIREKFT